VFFGPIVHEANRTVRDLSLRERLVAVALVIPMVWIGVHPSTFTNPLDRAVTELIETMSRRVPDVSAAAPAAETHAALEPRPEVRE
jgi:NADH:ubiquinone oxidoreductase subunit 4 (subunit M)